MRCFAALLVVVMSTVYLGSAMRITTDKAVSVLDTSDTKPAPPYAISYMSPNVCSQGYQPIADSLLCHVVAKVLGLNYSSEGDWSEYPYGCQKSNDFLTAQMVWFNIGAGRENPSRAIICKQAEAVVKMPADQASFAHVGDGYCADDDGVTLNGDQIDADSVSECKAKCADSKQCHAISWYPTITDHFCALLDQTSAQTRAGGLFSSDRAECWNKPVAVYQPLHGHHPLTSVACHEDGRIPDIWLWNCSGRCGPNWGDLKKCKSLCDHIGECSHITHFSDGECGIYSQCAPRVISAESAQASTYYKTWPKVEVKLFDRVRLVEDVNGKTYNRWTQEGEDSFQLFREDLGTVSSVNITGQVSVILDRDVEMEVWVDHTDLVQDYPLLKEADHHDALIESLLMNFPRAEDMATFKCPITKRIFRVPVVASDGRTYEQSALEQASNHSEPFVKNYALNYLLDALTNGVVKQASTEAGSIQAKGDRKASADNLVDAQKTHFEAQLKHATEMAAKEAAGYSGEGDVEVSLSLPTGHLRGKFHSGRSVEALIALALQSDWAQEVKPWGVSLKINSPPPERKLAETDTITKDMNHASISVTAQHIPANQEELFGKVRPDVFVWTQSTDVMKGDGYESPSPIIDEVSFDNVEQLEYQALDKHPPALGVETLPDFKCPISLEFFRDPVVASDGHTYEREHIEQVIQVNRVSPKTRELLTVDVSPNLAMKSLLTVLIEKAEQAEVVSGSESKRQRVS